MDKEDVLRERINSLIDKEIEFIIDGAVKYAINAIKHDATMDVVELERYYASFINSPSAFPKSINEIFEVDDKISGFGIINPISFFGLKKNKERKRTERRQLISRKLK